MPDGRKFSMTNVEYHNLIYSSKGFSDQSQQSESREGGRKDLTYESSIVNHVVPLELPIQSKGSISSNC